MRCDRRVSGVVWGGSGQGEMRGLVGGCLQGPRRRVLSGLVYSSDESKRGPEGGWLPSSQVGGRRQVPGPCAAARVISFSYRHLV